MVRWSEMTRLLTVGGFALATLIARADAADKVTICHIPPGNPDNAHAITVGAPAVPAHVAQHGDVVCAAGNSNCCPGDTTASAVCTNFETDANNCGGCGIICATGETCTDGECSAVPVPTCTAPGAPCGACGAGACFANCGTPTCALTCINRAVPAPPPPCATDADCPPGAICVSPGCAGGLCDPTTTGCFFPCP